MKFLILGALLLAASSTHAEVLTFSGTGGPLADVNADGPGVTQFVIPVSAPGLKIDSVQSVTLNGLTHSSVGDLQVIFFKSIVAATYLFSPPPSNGADLAGDYVMVVDPSLPTIDEASDPLATTDNIPSGSYAISQFGDGFSDGERTSYADFTGITLDGNWALEFDDFDNLGGTGALTSWSFTVDASPIPEPASLGVFAAGLALFAVRRR